MFNFVVQMLVEVVELVVVIAFGSILLDNFVRSQCTKARVGVMVLAYSYFRRCYRSVVQ